MNKPKLNQPDVEITTTTTGESITINKTIPSKQFKDIFVTDTPIERYNPTLEEVKQEWEELGYEWRIPKEYPHMIYLVDDDDEPHWVLTIKINTQSKKYWKRWGNMDCGSFSFQEHQLLTKTFRALGWFDE